MTLKTAIELPSPTRVGGGLLSASRPLPPGWERGVLFNGSTCLGPASWPYCLPELSPPASPPQEKTPDTASAVAEFEPTGIHQAVECTTFSQDRAATLATEALDVTAEYQLGLELATAVETGNPSLADASSTTAGDVVTALAAIENSIAGALYGRLGYIHVSPGMLVELLAADLLTREGRTWRSPMGNTVVASPGYVTLGDNIHATAEVFASLSVPETRVDVDRSINQSVAYAEQIGLAAFDPCFNIAVEVTS